ncbi:cadmium-translocating P-type ATPase [Sporosarcina sp. BI001-red]|uniref:heavy metal translocating P-type ATPase n=1 Tax=Sporosarcina sp. BI001-red TaxID=2282866 RepID=UPI000E223FD6|nr:cation-translocating P-type ATPase [Sporosarcina sp. BI001-red]REB07223.1 cadmium-translocating P-type ATPase [Sporosarcina sp. BI001-red]
MSAIGEIVHAIPGRTRVKCTIRIENPSLLEAIIRNMTQVISANVRRDSNSVVIYHETEQLPKEIIQLFMNRALAEPSRLKRRTTSAMKHPKVKELGITLTALVVERMLLGPASGGLRSLLRPTSLSLIYASRDIISNGLRSVLKPNEDTLTTAAIGASLLKGTPFSAIVIFGMSAVSELLNEYTIGQTRGFIRDMMEIGETFAWKITDDGTEVKVPSETIVPGDAVMIFQGDKVPFDGEAIAHEAEVDQSAITGEYLPVHIKKGCFLFAGSVVTEGKIAIRVERTGEDLTVSRMIRMIEEAQDKQSSVQLSSQNFTKQVVPMSFLLAGAIYFITRDWNRVLNMLVIDYVCGVQLSTATAISATIGNAAQQGILMKGGQTIEKLAKADTVVLDKTGTITEGLPIVTAIHTYEGWSKEEVLSYAASVEEHSTHPLASAILTEAARLNVKSKPHDDETMENHVGRGVSVIVDDEPVFAGSLEFLKEQGIALDGDIPQGIYLGVGNRLVGIFEIQDKIRPGMNDLLQKMKNNGIKERIMLTGDNESAAKQVMENSFIDHYSANQMPEDKAEMINRLKQNGKIVMMIGDGINDAAALATADVGIAMGGKKTDIAMETADVVIHSDNPILIDEAGELSRKAMRIIRQNIRITLVINTGAILLGTFGMIPPVVGAAVHNAATIGVVANSAKLLLKGGS